LPVVGYWLSVAVAEGAGEAGGAAGEVGCGVGFGG
jgi:hypothetical protein